MLPKEVIRVARKIVAEKLRELEASGKRRKTGRKAQERAGATGARRTPRWAGNEKI